MRPASAANWRARAPGSQNRKPSAVLGAVVVGELGGEIAGLRDLAAVELGGPMGRANEAADHPLQVNLHGRVVDGGLQRLGGEADLILRRLANAVVVDGVEPEGAAEPADEGVRRRVSGDQLEGDRLARRLAAAVHGVRSVLLSGLCRHDLISLICPRDSRTLCPRLSPRVRFDEAGHQAGGANADERGRVAAGAERQAMGPLVCSAVPFFRHWLGSARDAARPCRSRHLLPLAARPKPHARRGERRGHRVRGLWCFERLIRVGHRNRLAERRIPSSAPGRPAMWSLGSRLPATVRLLPGRWALRRRD